MGFKNHEPRYAHSEGHTDLTFDTTGRKILTCGGDGDIRVFAGFDDDDTISHTAGEIVNAVVCTEDRFFAATEDNSVKAFMFKDGESDGIITRFTAPVTHMNLNKDGTKLLAGASDFNVKLVDVDTSHQEVIQQHGAPVLSVSFDPNEQYAVSSSCDGTVKIVNLSDKKTVKTITGLPKTNDFSLTKTLCRMAWDKTGKFLAVPIEKEIMIFDKETWNVSFTLTDDSISETVSIVCFSKCGKYLAAACRDGMVAVFDFQTKQCVARRQHDKKLTMTAIAWHPITDNVLVYCDNNGYLGQMEGVVDSVAPSKQTYDSAVDVNPSLDLFDDTDDDMLVDATNPESMMDKEALDDGDDDDDIDSNMETKISPLEDVDENSLEADIEKLKKIVQRIDDDDEDAETSTGEPKPPPAAAPAPAAPIVTGWEPTPMQLPFQPSSSPVHWTRRYMVWNSVGVIVQYNTDEENSINIEFHDTATHHAMHITNSLNHTMGDMSTEAVVLACQEEEDQASKLVCMHFGSWDNCKEWTADMPQGEDIQAVALGDGWVAVVTDNRQVRIFTIAGIQREVFRIPGPVVAISGHTNQLLIVYHRGMAIPGDQNLGILLMQVTGKKKTISNGEQVPLNAKASLAWAGFTAEGTPITADTSGSVLMMNRSFGNNWTEIANMKKHVKGKSDHYWIVGLYENPQQLRAVYCKGSRYPQTLPRPNVAIIPYTLPLCEMSTDKAKMEETFWRSRLFSQHLDWWTIQGFEFDESAKSTLMIPQQETLMKMFALACKSDRECRAVEICEMMPSSHTVQLAIKYASRLKLIGLADKLNEIARRKVEDEMRKAVMEEEEEEQEEEDFTSAKQSGYSHTTTEMSSNKHTRQVDDPDESVNVSSGDEEETSIYEELEEENGEKPKGPMLNINKQKTIQDSTPKSLLHSQGGKKNPFKTSSQKTPSTLKGTSVFDRIEKPKSKQAPIGRSPFDKVYLKKSKKKDPAQAKLFQKKETKAENNENEDTEEENKPITGFQLWFDEQRCELEYEHPDVLEADLMVIAAKAFKELDSHEKQTWNQKASGRKEEGKKRKREESGDNNTTTKASKRDNTIKPVLSANTSSKLANFALKKK